MATYNDELMIDQDALDREWIHQPSLYMKYAEASAQADADAKEAKDKLELIEAKQFKDIVLHADKKPSDSTIQSEVKASPEYQDALAEYNGKVYEAKVMAAVVRSFEQRKSALENLVKLWAGQYFSAPREERKEDSPSIKEKGLDQAQSRQRAGMSRKKK